MRKSIFALSCVLAFARVAAGTPVVLYSNLQLNIPNPMAAASRPQSAGKIEIEAADDFIIGGGGAAVTEFKFIGLLTGNSTAADIQAINLEVYRVFPKDSTNPPSGKVPTRVNSPSDVAFADADSTVPGSLAFSTTSLGAFSATNSVVNGIHPSPGQTTGGDGAVRGTEIEFDVLLNSPMLLPADHYFFVPQVQLVTADNFLWLSALRPIVAPGTPINPDLQAWIRNGDLEPDWLRIGTDIVGGGTPPTFNMAFEVDGEAVPEPATLLLFGTGLAAIARRGRKTR